ncbi:trypsin Inhibitor like cysteine rich domain protein [Oesophagostomum dentatum]|uniref:Trypsin Inhibitor like cysteine rich domain protein n=1 Tax=Oesophagostomum dentatum TaxID=61180 RepID=A0A0B1SIM9_OESDE|nr:trypsin Inhibitor like cysteine rich domain protein [Oesophagostomum dentatum]
MNTAISVLVCVLLCLIEVSGLPRKPVCGKNEYLESGCVDGCEPTCAYPSKGICNAPCKFGQCVCEDGYYRNAQGNCTEPEKCSSVRKSCAKPLRCQISCLQKTEPSFCKNEGCIPFGCECKEGFVLYYDAKGLPTCIRQSDCP